MSGCFVKPTPPNCGWFRRTVIRDEFTGVDRECFFYEDKGRDISFPRWRVSFYYASHWALTKFFDTEAAKESFLAALPRQGTPLKRINQRTTGDLPPN